jgi:hypothetical protein
MELSKEFAGGMEHRRNTTDAAAKDVRIKSSEGACALGTGQRSNYAAVKDAEM